jgi:protein-tyrosine phosphatase
MVAHPESLSILVVCDGNVCRSPSAQFVLNAGVPHLRIESAGMYAKPGAGLCPVVVDTLSARGADIEPFASDFRSRRLSAVNVLDFNLVLSATTELRAELARRYPESRDRFFTLREAEAILGELATAEIEPLGPLPLIVSMNRSRGVQPVAAKLPAPVQRKMLDSLDIPDAHAARNRSHRAIVDLSLDSAVSISDSLERLTIK